jgi:O-antigen/teichoic acid export membrane protein
MANTLVLVAINIGGNLLLVPRWGITAAGITWGFTIVVGAALPGWQAHRSLGVSTLGRPALVAGITAAATIGVIAVGSRLWFGDTSAGLLVTATVGVAVYAVALRRMSPELHLDALLSGVRRRS